MTRNRPLPRPMAGTHYKVTDRANPGRAQVLYASGPAEAANVARNVMAYADPVATIYAHR